MVNEINTLVTYQDIYKLDVKDVEKIIKELTNFFEERNHSVRISVTGDDLHISSLGFFQLRYIDRIEVISRAESDYLYTLKIVGSSQIFLGLKHFEKEK